MASAVPVVIGVADVVNRSTKVEDAREPADLMHQAIIDALNDTGLTSQAAALQSAIDSIDVVNTWTWPYPDLPGLLSKQLGVNAKHRHLSPHGGNQPGLLFDEAAKRIALGQTKVAVVTGGEALASLAACAAAKKIPPPSWTQPSEAVSSVFSPTTRALKNSTSFSDDVVKDMRSIVTRPADLGALHDIGAPIQVYPLFENGYRAHRRQSIRDNSRESAKLYGDFAKVAEKNPVAWNYGKEVTEDFIGTVSKKNRMICFPYPLLMNAFNTINLAGAVILTSIDFAKQLGVPQERWIYALGAAGTQDSGDFWRRPNFHSSPSISRSIDAALQVSGVSKTDIDLLDFYSCFPIVPKLAAHHLGLSVTKPEKPITLLGGLTSFGGAGNNYSMHAPRHQRPDPRQWRRRNISACPHSLPQPSRLSFSYPTANPLPEILTDSPAPTMAEKPEGEAVVETYTVEFDRLNAPLRGHIVGRLTHSNERFLANHGDAATLHALCSDTVEPIGRKGRVWPDKEREGRSLFAFEAMGKL